VEAIKSKLRDDTVLADIQRDLPGFKGLEEDSFQEHAHAIRLYGKGPQIAF
jgi:hypothetical protein